MTNTVYTNDNYQKHLKELEKLLKNNSQSGGQNNNNEHHFKVVELDGQIVDFGYLTLQKKTKSGKPGPGPLSAAKKALRSISEHLGMMKDKKLKINVSFKIQEVTRGSSKKVYGPYKGHYRKFTSKEMKEKKLKSKSGKIITFTMEPVVKLLKKNNKQTKKKLKGGG